MPAPFRQLSGSAIADLLARFAFTRSITEVHMHHTWRPDHADYAGLASIQAMADYHVEVNGWDDIAQHVTVAPDGSLWTGRSWNRPPASSTGYNGDDQAGPFMFEIIGNFDVGNDTFGGAQRDAALELIAHVQHRFALPSESLRFHRQLGSPKTCPGTGIDYAATVAAVADVHRALWPAQTVARGLAGGESERPTPLLELTIDLSVDGALVVHARALAGDRRISVLR